MGTELGQELGNRFLRIPDLAAGRVRSDPRADVTMAVGVLFYLLTGHAPRVLADESLRPPHIAFGEWIPKALVSDPRWTLLRRLFDVGFQPAVDLRFQTADALRQRLDEMLEPPKRAVAPMRSSVEVQALNELLSSAIAAAQLRIERAMLESSRLLEQRLKQLAGHNGLHSIHNAGGAWVSVPGKRVEFTYSLVRRDAHQPQARICHAVELDDSEAGHLRAKYTVDANGDSIAYYSGPAADLERLHDEMQQHADEIFASAVACLREKVRVALA
jgi:serine/threonine-protein kinase